MPKSGKTTTATKFPKHLLLAAEKGYNAIPGAMAQPINSWSEFKKILRLLKDPKAKEKYETIILDTVDLFYDFCTKYVCNNAKNGRGEIGVDSIADIPFGKGYTLVAKEFDDALRSIVKMDYGLVMISHSTDKTFTDETGQEYNKIVPTLDKRATNIVSRMADIYGYSRIVQDEEGNSSTKLFIRATPRFAAGSRFKYTPPYIDFSYDNLVQAISDAISEEMKETKTEFFTNDKSNIYQIVELDFDALMEEFNSTISSLIENEKNFDEFWQPRIKFIIESHIGKGNRVNDMSREQTEALSLIVDDIKSLIEKNK